MPRSIRNSSHSTSVSPLRSVLSRSNRTRCMEPYVLLGAGVGDGVDRGAHDVLVDRADAADTQGVDLGELARIEHEALLAHAVVELLEVVMRVARRVEGDDHRRLVARLEEQLEAQAR